MVPLTYFATWSEMPTLMTLAGYGADEPRSDNDRRGSRMLTEFKVLRAWVHAHFSEERGATMVEYGIMVVLIAVVALLAVKVIGEKVNAGFKDTGDCLSSSGTC
jgi:Flp pilus assembly pilin Flp